MFLKCIGYARLPPKQKALGSTPWGNVSCRRSPNWIRHQPSKLAAKAIGGSNPSACVCYVPVAQLDRASDYESEGWKFDSSWERLTGDEFCSIHRSTPAWRQPVLGPLHRDERKVGAAPPTVGGLNSRSHDSSSKIVQSESVGGSMRTGRSPLEK